MARIISEANPPIDDLKPSFFAFGQSDLQPALSNGPAKRFQPSPGDHCEHTRRPSAWLSQRHQGAIAACAWSRQSAATAAATSFFMEPFLENNEPLRAKGFVDKRSASDHQVIWMVVCMMVLSVEMVLALAW